MRVLETTSEAYLATLRDVYDTGVKCQPRGHLCRECVDYMFEVLSPDSRPIVTACEERNDKIVEYQRAEFGLYLDGVVDADVWAERASKFWKKIANPDGTINSNYGKLIFHDRSLPDGLTPFEWAAERLVDDLHSRQAYIRVSLPRHQWSGNKDQVCTMHVNFLVRFGQLHATTVIRSNDVVRGLVYDMPWFVYVQQLLADRIGVQMGCYRHLAHSMHMYERDSETVLKMLGRKTS